MTPSAYTDAQRHLRNAIDDCIHAFRLLDANQFSDAFPSRDLMDETLDFIDGGMKQLRDAASNVDSAIGYLAHEEQMTAQKDERLLMRELV